jgi:hypothetical protein
MQLPKSIEQMKAGIDALNLDAIKIKLLDKREGKGWSREYADQMEIAYKRFLLLSVKYPSSPIIPTLDIDAFWHYHILDTMKYAEDCQNAFGFFLHHFPYIGLRGKEDAANLHKASSVTRALYEKEFGESMSISKTNSATCTDKIYVDTATCTEIHADTATCTDKIYVDTATCTEIYADTATCTEIYADTATCTEIHADTATCTDKIFIGNNAWMNKDIVRANIRPTFVQ